jgi:hypothetical protein
MVTAIVGGIDLPCHRKNGEEAPMRGFLLDCLRVEPGIEKQEARLGTGLQDAMTARQGCSDGRGDKCSVAVQSN